MATVCCATRKGGVGKTLVAVELALAAVAEGREVVLLDADRQRSAVDWIAQAGAVDGLEVVEIDTVEDLARFRRRRDLGGRWVIIDAAPGVGDWPLTVRAMAASDLVIVPMRPTLADLSQYRVTVNSARQAGSVAAVLLNQVRGGTRAARVTRDVLDEMGDVLRFDTTVPLRESIAAVYGTATLVEPFPQLWAELVETVELIERSKP